MRHSPTDITILNWAGTDHGERMKKKIKRDRNLTVLRGWGVGGEPIPSTQQERKREREGWDQEGCRKQSSHIKTGRQKGRGGNEAKKARNISVEGKDLWGRSKRGTSKKAKTKNPASWGRQFEKRNHKVRRQTHRKDRRIAFARSSDTENSAGRGICPVPKMNSVRKRRAITSGAK